MYLNETDRLCRDPWHYKIHGSGSQVNGRYSRRLYSDLFLVVIHRLKNSGRILNRRGDFVQRSSICESWFAFGFRICVPGVGVVDLGFVP